MLSKLTEQFEKFALRTNPAYALRFLNRMPPALLSKIQLMKFRRTLKLAARAPFYAGEFQKRGINVDKINHPSDLGDFFTTGADLQKYGAEAFLVGKADTAFETTGTTSSEPKRVFFSSRELNEMGRVSAIGLYNLGLRREDVVLSAFDVSFWVSPAVVRAAFQYLGCFHAEAGKIAPEEFYERAVRYKPNVIFGEPSWIVRLSEIAAERGTWKMKFLFALKSYRKQRKQWKMFLMENGKRKMENKELRMTSEKLANQQFPFSIISSFSVFRFPFSSPVVAFSRVNLILFSKFVLDSDNYA